MSLSADCVDDLTAEIRDVLLAAMQPMIGPEALALHQACAIRRHFAGQYLYFGTGAAPRSRAGRAATILSEYHAGHARLVRQIAHQHKCSIINVYQLTSKKKRNRRCGKPCWGNCNCRVFMALITGLSTGWQNVSRSSPSEVSHETRSAQ